MKIEQLKKIIKEAVKEVFNEELKEILLESIKSNKTLQINEHSLPPVDISSKPSPPPPKDVRKGYMDLLGDMALSRNSKDVVPFNPGGVDPINGSLPEGEVDMGLIKQLLSTK